MITLEALKSRTAKDLAALAKRKGVSGWHSMRKEDLIKALVKLAKAEESRSAKKAGSNGSEAKLAASLATKSVARLMTNGGKAAANGSKPVSNGSKSTPNGSRVTSNGAKPADGVKIGSNGSSKSQPLVVDRKAHSARTEKRLEEIRSKLVQGKDLALVSDGNGQSHTRDRLVVLVRGPYWLHACWELTRASVERARVALGQQWHSARPVLRVSHVVRDGTTSSARKFIRDIEIHGGVNNWYVDVLEPPRSFQMDIGYLCPDGRFLSLARSNVVSTPPPGAVDALDHNWTEVAQDFERIYAMSGGYSPEGDNRELKNLFEERLHRPMGATLATRFGLGAGGLHSKRDFNFHVDAELVVYGITEPGSHVTLKGEPVRLQPDGTFTVRFNLPDRRQVLPVVAASPDGVEQRTIVLAVERNTKVMEPVTREPEPA